VEVPDNGNLREVCLREGVRLYYGVARLLNCGGKARCGTCRVRVLEGVKNLSAPSPFERKRLPDPAEGVRLACQANVRGPMVVDTRA
jgi:ferredoxin